MAGITVADLEKRYKVPEGFLDEECTSEHIREIALELDEWEMLGTHLLLSEGQIEDIKRSSNSQQVKRKNVLTKWKEAHAFTATYRRLLEVLLTIKRADLACTICQLVLPQQGHLQATHSSPIQHLPMRPKQPLAQSAPLAAASSQMVPVSTVSPSNGTIGSPQTTSQGMSTRSITAHHTTIKGIENEFLKVVVQVEESFNKGVPLEKLQRIACHLPVDLKGQFGRLFQEESSRIWRAKTIGELFTILSYFWDYLHPDLLLYLVGRFDIEETMVLAAEYERNLSEFRKQVKIFDYIGERSINLEDEDYTPIVAIFGDEWCDKTLADLEEVRRSFAKRFSFLRLLPKMNGLKYNSIAIIFSVPKFVRLDHEELREFFQSYNALKLSVGGVCIYDSQPQQAISEDEISEVITEGQQEASVVKGKEDHSDSEEQETGTSKLQSKSKSNKAGGFSCQFIEKPPKAFQSECPVCLQILREPYLAICCGHNYCKLCVEKLKEYNSHCPMCNEENITAYPNKGLQRSLYDYEVYCTHKDEGCEWTGELRQLERHLNSSPRIGELQGCLFTHVDCKFKSVGCKETPCRGHMPTHLREHSEVHLKLLQTSNSPLNVVFIEDQQQIAKLSQQVLGVNKMKEQYEQQLSDANKTLKRLTEEYERLQKQIHTQDILPSSSQASVGRPPVLGVGTPTPPVTFTMTNFEAHKREDDYWYSPPFYTHHQGYKMCLLVYANGWPNTQYHGTHVSVYISLKRGEFDDSLKWPFTGSVIVKLLDQDGERRESRTITFNDETCPLECRARVTEGNIAPKGFGYFGFIPHSELQPRYLKNDCLLFRIASVFLD